MFPRESQAAQAPSITVIVPAYGVADLVGEALESIQAQTLASWECIVIDDGALDDVAGAVAPYLADPRIRLIATRNRGVSAARNRAIGEAASPYIALLDGDDLYLPPYLEECLKALKADPDARLATCNARIFGAVARERLCVDRRQGTGDGKTGSLADVLDRSFNVYIGSAFRRADWLAVGGFDESMTHAEDFDFWVRLLLAGGHATYIDKVLGEYRVRPSSASASGESMIRGNLRVYEKALPSLEGRPEFEIARGMIAANEAALQFEEAISRVLAGDTRQGLADLRKAHVRKDDPVWRALFVLWGLLPSLARPMLSWRRRSHSRGKVEKTVPALGRAPQIAVQA